MKDLLLPLADYIENVPQDEFDMGQAFREDGGPICVLGHFFIMVGLDYKDLDSVRKSPERVKWAGLPADIIAYMTHPEWRHVDNTPVGAAKRIRYVVEHGLPSTWEEEIKGEHPLSYL